MSEKQLRKNSVNRVCNGRILSAYPVHKQMNLMREGGHDLNCMDTWVNAQRDACKAHELAIEGLEEGSTELRDYDIYADWPDDVDAPAETPLERALTNLEKAQEALNPAHEEPPAAIADMFQTDRPYAEQAAVLWKKYNELTNKIMMKLATESEIKKHQKLQGELDWIKRHAFEGV